MNCRCAVCQPDSGRDLDVMRAKKRNQKSITGPDPNLASWGVFGEGKPPRDWVIGNWNKLDESHKNKWRHLR